MIGHEQISQVKVGVEELPFFAVLKIEMNERFYLIEPAQVNRKEVVFIDADPSPEICLSEIVFYEKVVSPSSIP